MLIINDVDIIETNANRIYYHSTRNESQQKSNKLATSPALGPFSTTPPILVHSELLSSKDFHRELTDDQSASEQVEDKNPTPISQISQCKTGWTIQGIVTNKTNTHYYKTSRGEGTLFSFDLLDEADEIRATAFNSDCSRFFPIIEIGQTYSLTKATVKPVNR
ncbi:unnamed protein product [Rotaria socialis]|uniref:OB domain-containing protein n=1 Tax=Rotaria socialis TaxID=392032 RepID=A0A817MQW3_9BILA|nr:unnamed protein product [Rotaria socialis]